MQNDEMETRPRIHLKLSQADKMIELTGKVLLFVLWVLTLYFYLQLPSTIPIHYNVAGQVNDYGNKSTLFLLPGFGTLIYIGLTLLNKYPYIFNYIPKITTENAQQQYAIATRMLRILKVAILLIFCLLVLFIYLSAKGLKNGIGIWFLPFALILIFVPVIVAIIKSINAK